MDTTIVQKSKNLMMQLLELASDGRDLVVYMKKTVLIAILAIAATTMAMAQVGTKFYNNGLYFRVTSVTPNNVEVIKSPHYNYSGNIDIPSSVTYNGANYSVTSIENKAFYMSWSLNSVNTGDSVTSIADSTFYKCSSLTSVNIGNSVTSIGSSAFEGCSRLTSANIGNSVTSIGDRAFYECSSLTSINIPNSVTSIGEQAFYGCSRLTSANIGNSVTSIGHKAFRSCSSLTSIDIPNSVTSIGEQAFYGCSRLTSANIGNSVTSIGHEAFRGCSSLTSIDIPNSVTSIGEQAFYGCSRLISANIGNSVTSIEDRAFDGCISLTTINIPNSVNSIGNAAFWWCSGLTSVNIGNSVTSIGEQAFLGCGSLTYINIPNSVTSIGRTAFLGCSSLKRIKIDVINPTSITLGQYIFNGVHKGNYPTACILFVPTGSVSGYSTAPQWSEFMPNIFESQNFVITYNQSTGGTLAILNTADGSNIPSGSQVTDSTTIEIVATPDNGYHLDSIKVNGAILANDSTVVISQNTTIEAFFSLNRYEVLYTHTAGGTLAILNTADGSNIPSGSLIEHGTVIRIVPTPDNGYHLSLITVNGETVTNTQITVESYTNIYAEFATVTGIDHSHCTALTIYPTPASESVTVATEGVSTSATVTIADLSGRTVATAIATGSKTEINISHLPQGTYIVRIGDKVGRMVKK